VASMTRGDKTELSATHLSWLNVAPGSPKYDAFPRHLFVLYIRLLLGLTVPEILAPTALSGRCGCCAADSPLDPAGHHQLTCKGWCGPTFKRGHNHVVNSLVDAARSAGTPCTAQPKRVPTHPHSNKQGDLLAELDSGTGKHIVADVTVCHPVVGSPVSSSSVVGTWQARAMQNRYNKKLSKHGRWYGIRGLSFVPLVASTFGVLHADFVRFLWVLSRPVRETGLAVGEVREAGPSASQRYLLFAKLHARMAVASAVAAAMRLDGVASMPGQYVAAERWIPSDPNFASQGSLVADVIGPVAWDSASGG